MASDADTDTLIPSELLPELQAAAEEERRTPSEVVGEALETYLKNRRWRRLLEMGQARARALGLTEDDLPRLIAESREEARRGR
ncbi:MAG TPA: hypothetical protein VHW66_05385 [Stellaceae bacterium]|jgi:predicted transcriptional regulator|nr:hypothetical protein [Stellaceae bacterium]